MSIRLLYKYNYIAFIKNSIGSNIFRNLYAEVDGEKKDITEDGNLSCALFASSILYLFKLVSGAHATVDGTVKDLMKNGWYQIDEPKEGCVLVWSEADAEGNGSHKHVGFYAGDGKAISNSHQTKSPTEHDWQFGGNRKVETVLWNKKLD